MGFFNKSSHFFIKTASEVPLEGGKMPGLGILTTLFLPNWKIVVI